VLTIASSGYHEKLAIQKLTPPTLYGFTGAKAHFVFKLAEFHPSCVAYTIF
jgi:hypothetical protein